MPGSELPRRCGVLLHPTSLPGSSDVGDLGDEARKFVDFLVSAGQGLWQVLPLGPVGDNNSPYDSSSAFAGNPLLIAEDWLVNHGLLIPSELESGAGSSDRADFGRSRERKRRVLRRAFDRFTYGNYERLDSRFDAFRRREADWLRDFVLYQSIHDAHSNAPWTAWPEDLRRRDESALERWRTDLKGELRFHEFVQFLFDEQWHEVRLYANHHGIQIIGDIPIYVSFDSADVWAHQQLFELDSQGAPTVVAGVPPDYFSAVGQRWGNPCYRWENLRRTDYRWWTERFRRAFELTDIVRVDHFRAFQAGWQVDAEEPTAMNGRWVDGPGSELFDWVEKSLGSLPIIVEDLGLITTEVTALREQLGLPGMKVLQFAFGDDHRNPYLPHNFDSNCVVYTGTHDNDTTVGWFAQLDARARDRVERYAGACREEINWKIIRLAYGSVAATAIVPAQDLLGLGSEHRMNIPGTVKNDWEWRAKSDAFTASIAWKLRDLADLYGRLNTEIRRN